MVNIGLISAIIFYAIILIWFFKTRKKWQVQGILALYRTKLGLKYMDKLANFSPRLLKWIGYIGFVVGFFGMAAMFVLLIKSALDLLLIEGAPPGLAPVLPGVKIPGFPTLSFWHWLIGIFILATVHEFAHGVLARVHKLEVKSSGFGFLGPILLAFVEPDEKKMDKASKKAQLSVYAAGPFSNFIFAGIFLLISTLIIAPISDNYYTIDGLEVTKLTEGFPAEEAGLEIPLVIKSINGEEITDLDSFEKTTGSIKVGDELGLVTDKGVFTLTAIAKPDEPERGFIGIEGLHLKRAPVEGVSDFTIGFIDWISLMFFWLFVLNMGVGLFNLLPLGPVDGGKMFLVASQAIFKNEKKAKKAWLWAMYVVLFLLFVNLLPWLTKLISFITGLFVK